MRPFSPLSLFDQAQYTSYYWLSAQALDHKLAAHRSIAEANLFEKTLTHLTQIPGFEALDEQMRSVLLAPLVRRYSELLNQTQFSIFNERSLHAEIADKYHELKFLKGE